MSAEEEGLLKRAADRAAQRPAYMAWVLSQYVSNQGISPTELVAELRSSQRATTSLALCLRPRPDRFVDDVNAMTAKFGVDGVTLARIVKHVEAIEAMAGRSAAASGTLMAARVRRVTDPDKGNAPSR